MSKTSGTKTVFDQIVEHIDGDTSPSGPESAPPPALDADDHSIEHAPTDDTETEGEPTEDTNSSSTEAGDARTARSRLRRLARRAVPAVIGLVLAASLGSSAFFGWQLKQRIDTAAAADAALVAARNYAGALSSVDSSNVDNSFRQVIDGATGEFKSMYSQASSQLRQLLLDNKAVSHGLVADAAVKSATKDKVEVLMFLDQSITNAANTDPRIDRLRIVMTMERVDNRWLLSKLGIE